MTHADGTGGPEGFTRLGLDPQLREALAELGYEEPTPIQRSAIPPLLDGRDLLGQAATGTGKTAAFALPVLHRLAEQPRSNDPAALVLVPTRELAVQVAQAFQRYGQALRVRVLAVYGGQPIGWQLRSLARGVDVVVATPGRALDHLARGTLRVDAVSTVVLDEADEMLDMGFAEDIEAILAAVPADRQTALFSATMPARINSIAQRHLRDPIRIEIGTVATDSGQSPLVQQRAYLVPHAYKPAALARVLEVEAPSAAVVFCRTREEVDALTETMNGRGYRADALHGGMGQEHRDRVMARLRTGGANLVVATDVAARGIDVPQLSHVINYHVPVTVEAYVHRIGRVGRAGRQGAAVTLASPRESRMLKTIERVTRQRITVEKLPTVADVRARQLEQTAVALRQALQDEAGLERFQTVLERLSDEYDLRQVALAAVKLAHEASGRETVEEEIPELPEPGRGRRTGGDLPSRHAGRASTRLFLGLGRRAGIRPQDLVGAIAGESRLRGQDVGAIEIADRFSLVEVPAEAADEVIDALRRGTIKGKKPTVRRDRGTDPGDGRHGARPIGRRRPRRPM
jgi:ATP-dependent RNA helicase DeaD